MTITNKEENGVSHKRHIEQKVRMSAANGRTNHRTRIGGRAPFSPVHVFNDWVVYSLEQLLSHALIAPSHNLLLIMSCLPYRTDVANCTSCVEVEGCGYCLSTLQCIDGTSFGPLDGSPCPSWITEVTICPGENRGQSRIVRTRPNLVRYETHFSN